MSDTKEVLFGLYDDEQDLMKAIEVANSNGLDIMDVYTPFPVHGLDHVMGLSESRLHQAGFVYGMLGTLTAFGFMSWVFTRDWPIIFGGKPYFSAPSFIPITFELTVLFASIGMVVTFYVVSGLGPGITNRYLHPRITDDKFCIAFETEGKTPEELEGIRGFFGSTGASEVHQKEV